MNMLEERLANVLTRKAEAVVVEPDLQRVLNGSPLVPLEDSSHDGLRRPQRLAMSAVAAAVVVLALMAAVLARSGESTTTRTDLPEPSASPTSADLIPRMLVKADAWSIVRVQRLSPPTGEMVFSDPAGRSLEFTWNPAADHDRLLDDRRRGSRGSWPAVIAGSNGEVFQYAGRLDFTALWRTESHSFELRGSTFASLDDFLAVLSTVQPVDVVTWTAALPEDVVLPEQRGEVVADLLRDLPVPDGFGREYQTVPFQRVRRSQGDAF